MNEEATPTQPIRGRKQGPCLAHDPSDSDLTLDSCEVVSHGAANAEYAEEKAVRVKVKSHGLY